MNKVLCILSLFVLIGCVAQIESTLHADAQITNLPAKPTCTSDQITDLLKELNIHITDYEYIKGDCTGWADSKKVELQAKDSRYSIAAIHRSHPNAQGLQFCFSTEKENDSLFATARNQICEELKRSGFDKEYINCKEGKYDTLKKSRIHLKFGSTRSSQYFSQVNEDCMAISLPH